LPGPALRAVGLRHGIVVGTAVRAKEMRGNRAYRQLIGEQFLSVTPENEMKWYAVEPQQDDFEFGDADYIVEQAEKNKQAVRGHALLFHGQLPGWVYALDSKALRKATARHISTVVGRYRGRVASWDVVNEGIDDDGHLKPTVYEQKLGPGYIASAFRLAHKADPQAKLFINEIGAESKGPKSDRLFRLVRDLRAQGVSVDGVGFQVHANLAGIPPTFAANMRRFAGLGVELAISEADVALKVPASADDLRRQAAVYTDIVRACLAVKACRRLTFWGFTDGRSWISQTQPGNGAATLLDAKLRPKPAFEAVRRALEQGR
jgi:endo-1,4-beta-xylanase